MNISENANNIKLYGEQAYIILMYRIRQNRVSDAGIKRVLETSALLLRMKGE